MGAAAFLNTTFTKSHDYEEENFQVTRRYRPLSIDELVRRTKFSKKEIQLIYRGFKQECPSGVINEERFKNIYSQFFPSADGSTYAHFIFSTFDTHSSGSITFDEFIIGLSILCRGSLEDRLRWIFSLYDTSKTGKLTEKDFQSVVYSVYALLGTDSSQLSGCRSVEEHAKTIFEKFNRSQEGFIIVEDFVNFCLKDSTIVQSLESFRNTV